MINRFFEISFQVMFGIMLFLFCLLLIMVSIYGIFIGSVNDEAPRLIEVLGFIMLGSGGFGILFFILYAITE